MKKTIVFLLVLSAFAALSGCGGGGGDNTASNGSQPATPSTPTTPTTPVVTTDSTIVATAPAGTYSDADKLAAYNYLNAQRVTCGFGALAQNAALDKSAQSHAEYVATNVDAGRADAYGHTETGAYTGFTGVTPLDRANFRGYGGILVGEDLTADVTANAAIQNFLGATYHAVGALRSDRDVGLGTAMSSTWNLPVVALNFGLRSAADEQLLDSKTVATYPCDGQIGVTKEHIGETPSPIPGRDFSKNRPGLVLVAMVRVGQTLTVSEFSLTPEGGTALKTILLTSATDPNKMLSSNVVALIPDAPLAAKTTYTAKLVGTNNGQAVNKTWSFTTQ